ncbi:hypothetical protein PybrP1_012653, partial [[Pythium] brassicae (nom. inval.)]
MTLASRAVLAAQTRALYAQCLRSARRCPAWEQREMMKAYVRMKFRHDAHVQDPARIRALLADAAEELERMDYYHSLYQAKLREQEAAASARSDSTVSATTAMPSIAVCPHCSAAYQPPSAKFCSACGEK